ncbi:MAG: replicative DNA helicase [Cytophagales bacterium]|nr:replicative DNA helicase [Cytophagales bacterium]
MIEDRSGKPLRKAFSDSQRLNRNGVPRMLDADLGKVPPQAPELEEAVLGALMLEKDALTTVIDMLKADSFYKDAHKEVYRAILELFAASEPVDMLTVTEKLRQMGKLEIAGGVGHIAQLTNRVNSAANIEAHARVIAEKAIKRELIWQASEILRHAFEDTTDVFNLLDFAEQGLFQISESNIRKKVASMRDLMQIAIKELEAKKDHKDGLTGIPSGFSALDRVTSGWQRSDLIILAARPAMGKCLGKGTRVVMFDGTLKKVEDVQAGDLLMGDDSTPRRVLSIARGRERMYWIRQNKGIDYRVNESHILSLKRSRNEGPHRHGDVLNISVRDYLTKPNKFKTNYKGYKVAVEFTEKEVSVHPYFLGLWLGDGHNYSSRITTQDAEVVDYLHAYAEDLQLQVAEYVQPGECANYAITKGSRGGRDFYSVQNELRKLNVLQNKHIPQAYLSNSTQNRLWLLAGLIDSDGHYLEQSNGYEITQKNRQLAEQIKFLCDSLGFRVSLISKKASISSTGYETEVHRVRIYGDVNRIPVRIERKKAKPYTEKRDWRMTGIRVEPDIVDDYYGFTLDGNNLFLLEDMTVTHNTAFVVSAMRNASVMFNMPVAIFSLEMSSVQLVNRLISAEAELESEKIKKGNLAAYEWEQLHAKIRNLEAAPIFIDDTPALSILELRAKCRRLKAQHDIQCIIIDYLQLMSGESGGRPGGNREQEVAQISRALKGLAKELNVPVIALSQLSRAVETRGGDKKPQLSDLRESGCVTGDTLVFNAETGERIPIKQLAERANPRETMKCMAVDDNYKVAPHNMVNAFYSGRKQVFELRTRSGRTIKASANHPFLKLNGWTSLDQLNAGDSIAVPRKLTATSPTNPLSEAELVLLAHLIGDGCILPKQPYHYTSADDENIRIVCEKAGELFGIQPRIVSQGNWKHVYLPAPFRLTHGRKHPVTEWFGRLGLQRVRSYEKVLPQALFRCDDERIALFLRHLWATDGNISWKAGRNRAIGTAIYYATASRTLAEQMQHLLLRLGIMASLKTVPSAKGYRDMYQLHITGKTNQLRFLQTVGCFGGRGRCVPDMIEALGKVTENLNYDVIPKEAWQSVVAFYKNKAGLSWRNLAAGLGMSYCGSALFKNGISRNRMQRLYEVLPFVMLKNLAESDVLWDEVVAVTPLGEEDVYDATVAEVHNFVANDFIIHNSIEQDADMVLFLYRPEYYGITQDENGNPTAGMGEVIIAKHRNGSLENVPLKFVGKYTKFLDWDGAESFTNLATLPNSGIIPPEFDDDLPNGTIRLGSKANNLPPQPPPELLDDNPPF